VRLRTVLALLACALCCAAASAPANPILPQDLPDPTAARAADGTVWMSGTSATLAPVFPLWRSDDLTTWRRTGAVLPEAPAWARGAFWAPELHAHGGRWFLYFSASERGGRACLAVATADRPEGPWSAATRVLCRPGGVIDASQPVTDETGQRWLAYKAMGVGGGIHIRRLTPGGTRVTGPEHELIRPDRPWERGVTEGPALIRRDGRWWLFYAGGNCCGPPCTYAQGVARSATLTGTFVKRPRGPVLRARGALKCAGHGTLLDDPATGALKLVHHAIRAGDAANRRRLPVVSTITWDGADGWPRVTIDDRAPAAPRGWSDGFAGRTLGPHWEWRFDAPPRRTLTRSTARLGCDGAATRQVEHDRWTGAVATTRGVVAGRERDGTLRGVERDGTRARATRDGRATTAWRTVPSGGRVLLTFGPDGALTASVAGTAIPVGRARTGTVPTRLALGCGSFASARVRAT